MGIKSVTIVGLGLIGGSFAKAIALKLPDVTVYAVDPNADSLAAAMADGVVSRGSLTLNRSVCSAELVLLCVPVEHIARTIGEVAALCGEETIVADAASVNGYPIDAAERIKTPLRFVSTHPMAGGEKGGYSESKHYLFENAYAILSPSEKVDDDALNKLREFYLALGAVPVLLPAKEHDMAAGVISHIPHIAASALVNLLAAQDDGEKTMQSFAAGGFKDITRIASSSADMWTSISLLNKQALLPLIDEYIRILNTFRGSLGSDDEREIHAYFAQAKSLRDSVVSATKSGYIPQLFDIYADVEDRVGAILIVAEILSRENVNIKNIGVQNNREENEGVLTISFSTKEDAVKATALLNENGIRASIK